MNDQAPKKLSLKEWFPSIFHLFLFVRVAAWTLISPRLLSLLSLPGLMRVLTPKKPTGPVTPELLARADLVDSYAIGILKRNPKYNHNRMCLPRSLVLYRFLRLSGVPARFCLGVRKDGAGNLIGHSWIEIDDEHYRDAQAGTRYHMTFCYPDRSPLESGGGKRQGEDHIGHGHT
jgi:hypothetical protein